MAELKERVDAPTPDWFKRIIKMGLSLAAAGTALLTAGETIPGFTLAGIMYDAAQWMVVAGLIAAAVSKTAKQD